MSVTSYITYYVEEDFHTKNILKSVGSEEEKQTILKNLLKEDGTDDETIFLLTPEELSKVFTGAHRFLKLLKDTKNISITKISEHLKKRRRR